MYQIHVEKTLNFNKPFVLTIFYVELGNANQKVSIQHVAEDAGGRLWPAFLEGVLYVWQFTLKVFQKLKQTDLLNSNKFPIEII